MPGGKVLSASYVLDASTLGPGIAAADAELGGLDASAADLSGKVDGHTAAMGDAFSDLGAGIGADVGAGVGDAKSHLGELDDAGKNLESDFDSHTSKIGSGFKKLGASLGNFGIPFSSALSDMGTKMDETSAKSPGLVGALSNVGKVASIAMVAGVAAFAGASIKMAMDYQSSVDSMAATGNMSINQAKNIGNAFLNMGGQTEFSGEEMVKAFGPVAEQLATVQGHTLSAAEAVQVESAAADLATASHTSLTSTTSSLASVMQAYGLKANQAASASNILWTASTMSSNGLDQVATMAQKLHTQMGDLTPPLSQVGTLMVALAKNGETGRGAISAVNSAMTSLVKPVTASQTAISDLNTITQKLPPNLQALAKQYEAGSISSEAYSKALENLTPTQATLMSEFSSAAAKVQASKASFDELGISVTNGKGNLDSLGKIFGELHDKIQGETQAQQLAAVSQVFGAGASRKLLDVINAGPAAWDKEEASVTKSNAAHDAASKASQALSVQMKIIGSAIEDDGTKFGNVLLPVLEDVGRDLADVTQFFMHNEAAAIALGVVIGGPLVAAMTVFAVETAGSMISSLTTMVSKLLSLPATFSAAAAGQDEQTTSTTEATTAADAQTQASSAQSTAIENLIAALDSLTEALTPAASAETEAATNAGQLSFALDDVGSSATAAVGELGIYDTAVEEAGGMSTSAAAEVGTLGDAVSTTGGQSVVAAGELDTLGASAEGAGAKMGMADAAAGEGGLAGGLGESAGAAGGLTGALLPLAAALVPVGMAVYAATHANDGLKVSLQGSAKQAVDMTATTLPQFTVKLDALEKSQEAASAAVRSGNDPLGVAKEAYNELTAQIDTTRTAQTNMSSNLSLLASHFDISKTSAEGLAQEAGINLQKALDPAQISAFGAQLQQMTGNADTAGTHIGNLSTNTINAMLALSSQLGTAADPAAWAQLGNSIDEGIASGVDGSSSIVALAAAGASTAALTAARHAIGSNSPSTKARDLVGITIPQGIAQGILGGTPLINSAMNEALKGLTNVTVPMPTIAGPGAADIVAGSGSGAGAGAGGATSSNSQTAIYLTVQGHVLTDRDLVDAVWQGLLQKGLVNGSSGQLTAST